MRKTLIAAGVAVALLAIHQVPALAAGPAPTEVQIGWADLAKKTLRVSWQDSGEKNLVRVEYPDLPRLNQFLVAQDAGGSNEVVLDTSQFVWQDRARVTVESSDGGVTTARTPSVWFDTQRAAKAVIVGAESLPGRSLRLSWSRAIPADATPNDPLDRPLSEETLDVGFRSTAGETYPVPIDSSTATVPAAIAAQATSVNATNEWGKTSSDQAVVQGATTAILKISPVGQFQRPISFTATAEPRECLAVSCPFSSAMPPTQLQARPDATKPWKTIGTYTGYSTFTRTFPTSGGREYRLYVPAWQTRDYSRWFVGAAVSTSARYSATQAYLATVGFTTNTAQVGQVVKLAVKVLPAGTVKASLQSYDGKVWRHSTYVPLTKGVGTYSFKAAGRGTTRYWRVVVPKMTMNGLPIVATTSKAFKLTVR
ncbi:hypothetical protein [Kribbella sp. CA-293567]|uniref:hypothetical protein n=1 Tax=Kribbella sp. CA-293567 TaxID=3002436 RepID=UPI0022DE5C6C|nr:hypothetical protein [Kribbella sp. CA-293567]WBQ04612.1 hypothetical protein OX958_32190 [Kribbella sp. CA-293567]